MDKPAPQPLDFEACCRYVGQLFLETRHELERLSRENVALKERLNALAGVQAVPRKD